MNLPEGKTCGDCVHTHRCKAMFGHVETDPIAIGTLGGFGKRGLVKVEGVPVSG